MTQDSAFDYLYRHIAEQREIAAKNVLTGRASVEEYHRLCGVIQGLDFAKDVVDSLAKMSEEDND